MPCYKPLSAQMYVNGQAKQSVRVLKKDDPNKNAELPCGRCIGCRLDHARDWALRIHHESLMHDQNIFITLTYSPEHLPKDGSLNHDHFQKFLKRLRFNTGEKIRYFMCGEYGDNTFRPHYHAIIFGYQFPDRKLVNIRRGNRVWTSEKLDKTWGLGSCEIGSVTFKSAGYVARYILKKQQQVDKETGEAPYHNLKQPYVAMSLKPGIGKTYYETYKEDFFPHDFAVLPDGRQAPVPRYYRVLLDGEDSQLATQLREARLEKAKENPNNSPDRLAVREICKTKKAERLKRDFL